MALWCWSLHWQRSWLHRQAAHLVPQAVQTVLLLLLLLLLLYRLMRMTWQSTRRKH
jgi:hypothetical protein